MECVDVACVGAGPAGLAAALAIKAVAPKLDIKVYDKARGLRPIGAGITVFSNGLDALHGILGPERFSRLAAAGTAMAGAEARSGTDEVLHTFSMQGAQTTPGQQTSRAPLLFSWHGLQGALLEQLGQEHLVLNKGLAGLKQHNGDGDLPPVELTFQDGSVVRAHLVVGADGNMSAVRAALFDGEVPKYIGTAFWRTMIHPLPSWWEHTTGWLTSWNSAGKLLAMRTFGDHLSVSAAAGWPEERLQELAGRTYYGADYSNATVARENGDAYVVDEHERHLAKRKRFLEVFGDGAFPERVTALLGEADPSTLVEHGVYFRDPEQAWGKGAATLVGDAAHVMPPNLGQGTSMAFEDAYCVAHQLALALAGEGGVAPKECSSLKGQHKAVLAALRAYEQKMQERVTPIALSSVSNANQFYQGKDAKASPMLPSQSPLREVKGKQVDLRAHINEGAGPFPALAEL